MGGPVLNDPRTIACPDCRGRGEVYVRMYEQPEHTKYPNPRWEPWEPETKECTLCSGYGAITPALYREVRTQR